MKQLETLTPNEISKILKLHPFTVTRLAREGKVPAFKVGGVWRFRKDEFEKWIKAKTHRRGANGSWSIRPRKKVELPR